jgi:hypothetical protein
MAKNYRSASTGRFVTKGTAARHPRTTVAEKRNGGSTGGVHRSAITGKFVTKSTAARHPRTTIRDS